MTPDQKQTDSETKPQATKPVETACGYNGDFTAAFLVLRLWLAVRAILAGVEKFGAYRTIQKPFVDPTTGMVDPSGAMVEVKQKFYALTNYSSIPQSLQDKFATEPMLPHALTTPFYGVLGWALLALGIMLLVGVGTRISLFLQGILYTALTIGLILIKQEDGVAWLGIHIALVAFALALAKYNRFTLLRKW
jgi:thiosulfate dehydrogenase [quinone] large subunit